MKLMQDERFMKAVMGLMSVPGRVTTFAQDQSARFARAMDLATEQEVKEGKKAEAAPAHEHLRRHGLARLQIGGEGAERHRQLVEVLHVGDAQSGRDEPSIYTEDQTIELISEAVQ